MILKGDCIEVMKAMKPNSVDAIVTDPPYGLEFMGKEWDSFSNNTNSALGGQSPANIDNPVFPKRGKPIVGWCSKDKKAMYNLQLWHTYWLTEAYRVLKPGGSMLVMGGTRTSHRLACAIEDSGFIIKDTIMWIYGSGFPKAQDLGKMIDKRGGQSLKRFGRLLKEARIKKGLSQKDIAKYFPSKTGGLTGCVWNWEEGVNAPTVDEVNKLIEILDLKEDKAFEAERKKIGNGKPHVSGEGKDNSWNSGYKLNYDITTSSTDLAKHWNGFKVGGIKPAYEPIIWAVKPPEGSYVDNVLKWGVGAVNVDECRISHNEPAEIFTNRTSDKFSGTSYNNGKEGHFRNGDNLASPNSKGRFPANVILSHHPECVQVGMKRAKRVLGSGIATSGIYDMGMEKSSTEDKGRKNQSKYETVESWDCHPDCAVRLLDEQSGDIKNGYRKNKSQQHGAFFGNTGKEQGERGYPDNGGASRFFYCAKASRTERNAGLEGMEEKLMLDHPEDPESKHGYKTKGDNTGKVEMLYSKIHRYRTKNFNTHPTVKPIKLFEWLIKLITREGQIVLDPFIGSGTTSIAAHNTGRKCMGIDKEADYLEIARRRITYWQCQPKQMEMRV